MTNERTLDDLLALLADERDEASVPGNWAEHLSARLADAEIGDLSPEDALALAPDVDPELGGSPIGAWLREDSSAAGESRDWSAFGPSVAARLDAAAPEAAVERWLAPEVPGPSVPELLREERAARIAELTEAWPRFASDVAARLSDASALDQRAIDQLGAEVDAELDAMGPRLDARFWHEVEARLEAPEASALEPTVGDQLRSWWDGLRGGWMWGGAGLAAAAAAVFLWLPPSGTEVGVDAQAALDGEVSLDAVDFEGDVMTIHDDGITVVVLTGV